MNVFFHETFSCICMCRKPGILPFELSSDEAYEKLMNDGKVFINSGTMYGRKAGQGYLRLNLACPRKTLTQGLIRIARILSQSMDEEDLSGCPA